MVLSTTLQDWSLYFPGFACCPFFFLARNELEWVSWKRKKEKKFYVYTSELVRLPLPRKLTTPLRVTGGLRSGQPIQCGKENQFGLSSEKLQERSKRLQAKKAEEEERCEQSWKVTFRLGHSYRENERTRGENTQEETRPDDHQEVARRIEKKKKNL